MFWSALDLQCPLRFSAYLGDHDTMSVLLLSSDWDQLYLDKSLALATVLGHERCVRLALAAGARPDHCDAVCHAMTQNHPDILRILLKHQGDEAPLDLASLQWAIHADHVPIVEVCMEHCPETTASSVMLSTALTSNSRACADLILGRMTCTPEPFVLHTALENRKDLVMELVRRGVAIDQPAMTLLRTEHGDIYPEVLRFLVKRRWRQVRAVARIWSLWLNFIRDYYSPGNQFMPAGKGFERSFKRFQRRLEFDLPHDYEDDEPEQDGHQGAQDRVVRKQHRVR